MAWLSSGRRNLRFEYDCTRQASQRDSVDHGSLGERVCLLPWLGIGLLFDSCGCPILGTAQFAFFTCTAASSWFERVQRAAWLSSGRRNSRFCGYGSYVAVLGTVAPATLSLRCSCERAAKSCMHRRCSDGDGGVRYAAFALRCTKPCRRRCRSGGDDGVRHAALALRCSNPAPCRCRLEGDRLSGSLLMILAARASALRNPAVQEGAAHGGGGGAIDAAFALLLRARTKSCTRRCRPDGDGGVRYAAIYCTRRSDRAPCRRRLSGDRRRWRLAADDTSSSRFGALKSCRVAGAVRATAVAPATLPLRCSCERWRRSCCRQ